VLVVERAGEHALHEVRGGADVTLIIISSSRRSVRPVTGGVFATLPQITFAAPYVARTGTVRTVNSGGDLQAAITAAVPGDVIVLEAGAVFAGNFTFPDKTGGGGDIYVVSSTVHAGTFTTPAGRRLTSGAQTATIRHVGSGNVSPVISTTGSGRTGWRFVGITVDTPPSSTYDLNTLIRLGNPDEPSVANYPGRFVFDRCRVLGRPLQNIRRAFWVMGPEFGLYDAQVLDINTGVSDGDSQCVLFTSAASAGLIDNCELSGATEQVVLGGLDANVIADTTVVPQDIIVRRSYLHHNAYQDEDEGGVEWNGRDYSTKNGYETKAGRRVSFVDSVIGRHLGKDQQFAMTIKSDRNATRVTPCEDVTIRNIKMLDVMAVIQTRGFDDDPTSARLQRITVDNLAVLRARATTRITPRIVQCTGWGRQLEFSRITAILPATNDNSVMTFVDPDPGAVMRDLRIRNSIFGAAYGMQIPGNVDYGIADTVAGERTLSGLVLVGRPSGPYSSFNSPGAYPANAAAVGFTSYSNSTSDDLTLTGGSPVKGLIGGADPGCDIATLNAATAGCITGDWS
jgi:hypothetical protein